MLKCVQSKRLVKAVVCAMALSLFVPIVSNVQAETLANLDQQETQLLQQSDSISSEIQATLTAVNDKYAQVASLQKQIDENQQLLTKTQQEIVDTQNTIEKRKEVVAKRLQSIQINNATDIDLKALLSADSFGDFVRRMYAMTMLQGLEKEKIESLNDSMQSLQELNQKAKATQAKLETDRQELASQAKELDSRILALRQKLDQNKDALAKIAADKEVEKQRQAAEQARQKREQEEAASKQQAAQTSQASQNTASSPVQSTNTPSTTTTGTSGKVMYMESTAYSYAEAGASYFTASGTDLRANPMAVAVDPSVIPLGTLLEVEGYGVALALDTGGAIKGNIIDVHFDSREKCIQWGRRQVKVTILS